MIADLYISHSTFEYNGLDDKTKIFEKFENFRELIDVIRKNSSDNILHAVKDDLQKTVIDKDGTSILDFLTSYEKVANKYSRDLITIFHAIFKTCVDCNINESDMKEYLCLEDQAHCNGIIVLNKLKDFHETAQVMANVSGWLKFRRYFLGKYPVSEDDFIKECKKYYPTISFGITVNKEIGDVLFSHSNQIINCLTILEDNLLSDYSNHVGDNISFINTFGKSYGLDGSSYQGDKDSKFDFEFEDGMFFYCESHLKMNEDDSGNKKQYCRIYFKPPCKEDTKVYVGYICRHL